MTGRVGDTSPAREPGAAGYLVRSLRDVPAGDAWLGERERAAQAELRAPARRRAWRLGRWAGKLAVGAHLQLPTAVIEILAAPDGAPEAWSGGEHLPVDLSLSHRAGLALAAAGPASSGLGCDAEAVLPRNAAFLRTWFADEERALLEVVAPGSETDLGANAVWTAKEAAAKVRRAGPEVDRRAARVTLEPVSGSRWAEALVAWPDAPPVRGWWRRHGRHVLCVMSAEPLDPPRALTDHLPV